MIFRSDNRTPDQLRPVSITPDFISTAEGSALIEMGNTRVICTASIEETVPVFLRNTGTRVLDEISDSPVMTSDSGRKKHKSAPTLRQVPIE